MYYTNGRIIIHDTNNAEDLAKAVKKLQEWLLEDKGMKVEFKIDPLQEFPAYTVPSPVTYHDMENILRPHLALKAINENIIALPSRKTVSVKHVFDENEKNGIAIAMSKHVLEKFNLEGEKARATKDYNSKIQVLEDKILEESNKHITGYEYRDYETIVKLNFADNRKYFVDVHEQTVIRQTEPLEPQDYQLRLDHTIEEKYMPEVVNEDATEEGFTPEGDEDLFS